MIMTKILKGPIAWGLLLSAEGKEHDDYNYVPTHSLSVYDRCTPYDDGDWGRVNLYWDYRRRYLPANRRANKILRPIFEGDDMIFPSNGVRGDAFIREGKGERYHLYFPLEMATGDECLEWAEENLTLDSYFFQPLFDQWLLILGDDESDHFKAQMRWG
jgi:hypothetical protein